MDLCHLHSNIICVLRFICAFQIRIAHTCQMSQLARSFHAQKTTFLGILSEIKAKCQAKNRGPEPTPLSDPVPSAPPNEKTILKNPSPPARPQQGNPPSSLAGVGCLKDPVTPRLGARPKQQCLENRSKQSKQILSLLPCFVR